MELDKVPQLWLAVRDIKRLVNYYIALRPRMILENHVVPILALAGRVIT